MVSGGSRTRSGPTPDPAALRRNRTGDSATWTTLPAEGRPGPAPAWPLPNPMVREKTLWVEMWRRPQAVMWERLDLTSQVALYIRCWVVAERRAASVPAVTLIRQLGDALGLTAPGMGALRWRIATDDIAAQRVEDAEPERVSSRQRLTVVPADEHAV